MRRLFLCLIITALATPLAARAQQPQQAEPHAWLYGSWTGGLFPVPAGMSAQACLAQPVVIFTRDLVLRATLIDRVYQQRNIETVRSEPGMTSFRFSPMQADPGTIGARPDSGFGCGDPDTLHVTRRGENEIVFEGCVEFPEPLYRCPAR
jgi:hypothetical protein